MDQRDLIVKDLEQRMKPVIGVLDDPREPDWKALAIRYRMALEVVADNYNDAVRSAEVAIMALKND